jgi:guanylate kinase
MHTIITLVGPSCSGKTTLLRKMMGTGKYTEVISTTTRPMRVGEVDGDTYHFVTPEEFGKLELLERIEYNGNIYGGTIVEFEEKFATGKVPVIIVEPNGMIQINENAKLKGWNVVNIWVGCSVELQAMRFLDRFVNDLNSVDARGDADDRDKLLKEYAGRLNMMQTVEGEWLTMYRNTAIRENALVVPEYTVENEDIVLDNINLIVGELNTLDMTGIELYDDMGAYN